MASYLMDMASAPAKHHSPGLVATEYSDRSWLRNDSRWDVGLAGALNGDGTLQQQVMS